MGIQINGQTDTVTATDGSINVGGDVTIPGVLTYEDVTNICLLYTSPSPRDATLSRMPSSA